LRRKRDIMIDLRQSHSVIISNIDTHSVSRSQVHISCVHILCLYLRLSHSVMMSNTDTSSQKQMRYVKYRRVKPKIERYTLS